MDSLCRCQRDSDAGMDDSLVIVGPGRLGRSAHQILSEAGHPVVLVGRHDPIPAARLTWLTVPDRAVAAAAQAVPAGGVVLHASGALDVDVLRPHPKAGSLHPLMSFPGPELDLPTGTVPAAIAGDEDARIAAHGLAEKLGFTPFTVGGDRRLYHAAAVIAGNFATTLLVEAGRALSACGVSEPEARRLLAPLATTSLTNTIASGADALTGPVARGDDDIIAAHQSALDELDPKLGALYEALTRATRQVKG